MIESYWRHVKRNMPHYNRRSYFNGYLANTYSFGMPVWWTSMSYQLLRLSAKLLYTPFSFPLVVDTVLNQTCSKLCIIKSWSAHRHGLWILLQYQTGLLIRDAERSQLSHNAFLQVGGLSTFTFESRFDKKDSLTLVYFIKINRRKIA